MRCISCFRNEALFQQWRSKHVPSQQCKQFLTLRLHCPEEWRNTRLPKSWTCYVVYMHFCRLRHQEVRNKAGNTFSHPWFQVATEQRWADLRFFKSKSNLLLPFYDLIPSQGRNEGGQGVHNSPGADAKSLWGAKSLQGAPNSCRGSRKIPAMSQVLSSIQYICFWKTTVSNMGAPDLPLAPDAIKRRHAPVPNIHLVQAYATNFL